MKLKENLTMANVSTDPGGKGGGMGGTKPSISIIVPCLNEAENIRDTVESIKTALDNTKRFGDCEILIFNDFSTDGTGEIAEEIQKKEPGVRVIHNPKNMGFGYNYTEGVRQAENEYIIMVPGDNEIPSGAIETVFREAGSADVIIPYTANTWVRPMARRVISRAFVIIFNALFGLRLRYYNGTCMIKSRLLKEVPMTTWGFAYMAAILVRLLKSGATYIEVGVKITQRSSGKTKAFRPRNIISVLSAIAKLFWEVRVRDRGRYSSRARRVESAVTRT
jgi:glycosyltransferase involved in cell wall biosynthesis